MKRNSSRLLKISFLVLTGIALLIFLLLAGNNVFCNTGAICDDFNPTISPETYLSNQFNQAIEDIEMGQYETAKDRLQYILVHDPEYQDAKEKLSEVERILELTPSPENPTD